METMCKDHRETLNTLNFDNAFVRELPCDPERANFRRQVTSACYSLVQPVTVSNPRLVAYSKEAAALLNLSEETCRGNKFTTIFSGNGLLPDMEPYAMCYGGHQFGNWAGQLGDGRAINLGEIINHDSKRWALQLKGAGPTPYSRNADGLAVLRSSLREFLCSEAMFHLGVPTTRALSLILTGESVERDMFYDGNPKEEPGAVLCRMAPSFTRFGNFQILAFREEIEILRQLMDYTIRRDFIHLNAPPSGKIPTAMYLKWFEEVCRRTADMIVHWMRVGFVHGVMNTDNMSVLGLTIDYGPYGWLENYDPDWTPNTTDANGRRYRFGHQPRIAHWNLAQLANAIYPLINDTEALQASLSVYTGRINQKWQEMMAGKLGLRKYDPETDSQLCNELFGILAMVETDMTIFFRRLSRFDVTHNNFNRRIGKADTSNEIPTFLMDAYYMPEALTEEYRRRMTSWLSAYSDRLGRDNLSHELKRREMNRINPKYVLRNYMAQLAIDDVEKGDFSLVNELLELLRHPYIEQPENEKFAGKRPEWARHRPGCSMLSCSS